MKLHLTAIVTAIALSSLALTPVFAAAATTSTKSAMTSTAKMASTKKTATPDANRFASESAAQSSCATDSVVWANTSSKIFHLKGTATFGKGKNGFYMCQTAAKSEGFRPTKTPEKIVSAAK